MNTSQAVEGLDRCIRVRYPAIVILSPEEKRVWGANRAPEDSNLHLNQSPTVRGTAGPQSA